MLYRIILYIVFFLVLLVGFGSVLSADKEDPEIVKTFTDPVFERIGKCESGGNLRAKNPYSTASGEFQFIYGSWYHYGKEYGGDAFYDKNIWSTDNRELAWYV